jgi:hypothetical protein
MASGLTVDLDGVGKAFFALEPRVALGLELPRAGVTVAVAPIGVTWLLFDLVGVARAGVSLLAIDLDSGVLDVGLAGV